MRSPKIKKLAEKLLSQIDFRRPPISKVEVAKALGVVIREGPLPDDLSGFLLRDGSKAVIGINSLHSKARQTFTFAHECGHFVLHPARNFVDRSFMYYRSDASSHGADRQEVEANAFAAELLMPEAAIVGQLRGKIIDIEDDERVLELAAIFGVSAQALTYRLLNLRLAQS